MTIRYIILCGGIGSRNNGYSLPKPLNYINGKHMIEYIVENIPSKEIYIIYNISLDEYNFREIVINTNKNKQFIFSTVDYLTRGAVETAYVGIKNFKDIDELDNILFIDNDNIHLFPKLSNFTTNFIGYGVDYYKQNYSFINIIDGNVISIAEKEKISDNYCCGLYGFKNRNEFLSLAENMIMSDFKIKNEFYFSQLYKLLIQRKEKITPFYVKNTEHIGSYNELIMNSPLIPFNKLRICFDLDNTLVTFPTISGDYTTVKPIIKNIELLKRLKSNGHEIIIHTARRMKTHNNNIGKVMKDIAMITFKNLENFNIPYDEIIFGKPIADIYIDDKSINPYINDISYFGIFQKQNEHILNKICNNKYNSINKTNNIIFKSGPDKIIKGELYYYQNIPENLKYLFPKFIGYNKKEENTEIQTEYIKAIPLFYLYKNKLITENIITDLFNILKELHTTDSLPINISNDNIRNNYFLKLKNRVNIVDYPFEDTNMVFNEILKGLEDNYSSKITNVIHGDFWFSNILITYDNKYKLIDMKGMVDNILTLNGDIYYDYGKLYQSILGYDLVLNGIELDNDYIANMKSIFLKHCESINLNIHFLKYVTKSLVFGTFYFITNDHTCNRYKIWEFIKNI